MRCFVSREYDVSMEVIGSIDSILDDLNIERIDAFSEKIEGNIRTNIISMISEADFVIAVLSSVSHNVLFEIGLAVGNNKSVFLLIEDNIVLPFDLNDMTYIKINNNLQENMLLPLKYFINGLNNKKELKFISSNYAKTELEEKQFWDKLQEIKMNNSGAQFEKFIVHFFEKIENQYTTLKFANDTHDIGHDLALWIDELEGRIINPIVFNFKFGRIDQSRINMAAQDAMSSLNNGQMVIVLYCETNDKENTFKSKYPGIVVLSIEKFMQAVFKYGLPKAILHMRNLAAHGREL